jgi:hypothetical protein
VVWRKRFLLDSEWVKAMSGSLGSIRNSVYEA